MKRRSRVVTWARIPHFFSTPYYVYQYATCFASTARLMQDLRASDAASATDGVDRYLSLLRAGGSDYPMKLLAKAGVDLSQPDTVRAVSAELDMLVGSSKRSSPAPGVAVRRRAIAPDRQVARSERPTAGLDDRRGRRNIPSGFTDNMVSSTLYAPILDHMSALSDPTRCRMLLLLEKHELTVSELCAVLQMPQSSVSRHLKTLADDDWVASRRDGTSRFYSMPVDELDSGAKRLWPLIREQVATTSGRRTGRPATQGSTDEAAREVTGIFRIGGGGDGIGCAATCSATRSSCGRSSASSTPRWLSAISDAARDSSPRPWPPMCVASSRSTVRQTCSTPRERGSSAHARMSIFGRGTSRSCRSMPASSMPRCCRWCCTTRRRRRARSPRWPASSGKGGRVLVVDMLPHDRQEYQMQMGHVWLGFTDKQISRFLTGAGFGDVRVRMLPADPDARGPALFAAVGVKQ